LKLGLNVNRSHALKEAFDKAMAMLRRIGIHVNSTRLDKYYSYPSISEIFDDARVYIIPKKNATLKGSWKWRRELSRLVSDTLEYLGEDSRRNNSDSGFQPTRGDLAGS